MEERMRQVLARVAAHHGVTEEEVKEEIECAVKEAMESTNPEIQELWRQLSVDGKPPTAEELICILAVMVG